MKNDAIIEKFDPEVLMSNYTIKQKEEVKRHFTATEMMQKKDELFTLTNAVFHREKFIQESKAIFANMDFTSITDALSELSEQDFEKLGDMSLAGCKKRISLIRGQLDKGYEITDADLYGVDFQEVSRMAFYNADGFFVYDRPLTPTEKQTNIISLSKKDGTNG